MIRTRFAPSPTGTLHLGGARTALFNWLYARHHKGEFLLRIEDTDRKRSLEANERQILQALDWLGLHCDGEIMRQSERAERYQEAIQQLFESGAAYYCDCSSQRLQKLHEEQEQAKIKPRYDHHCRGRELGPADGQVVRLKAPLEGTITVRDSLKGAVAFDYGELDDLIIARGDGSATYHLAVVVDDLDAGITHVIRGDDHFNNTPRQMLILAALKESIPHYTHLPMILDEQGRKMSKRRGAMDLMDYREQGMLPTALINASARLGWAQGDQELFSREELIQAFNLDGLNAAASRVDPKKFAWINQQQMKQVPDPEITAEFDWHCHHLGLDPAALSSDSYQELQTVQRGRCRTVADMAEQSRWLWPDPMTMDEKAQAKFLTTEAIPILQAFLKKMEDISWNTRDLKGFIHDLCDQHSLKPAKVAQPLRVALTGGTVSPSIEDTLHLLGRERVQQRLTAAIAEIEAHRWSPS